MMGIGLLMMLVVIGVPVLFVVALVGGTAGLLHSRNEAFTGSTNSGNNSSSTFIQPNQAAAAPGRYCSHCGAGLQADWAHCPQCGAPVSQTGQ